MSDQTPLDTPSTPATAATSTPDPTQIIRIQLTDSQLESLFPAQSEARVELSKHVIQVYGKAIAHNIVNSLDKEEIFRQAARQLVEPPSPWASKPITLSEMAKAAIESAVQKRVSEEFTKILTDELNKRFQLAVDLAMGACVAQWAQNLVRNELTQHIRDHIKAISLKSLKDIL